MSDNETPETQVDGPEKHTVILGDDSTVNTPEQERDQAQEKLNEDELQELRVEDPNRVTEDMVNRVGGSDSTDTSEAHQRVQAERKAAVDEHDRSQLVYLDQVEDAEEAAREQREAQGRPSDRAEGEFTGSENDAVRKDDENA